MSTLAARLCALAAALLLIAAFMPDAEASFSVVKDDIFLVFMTAAFVAWLVTWRKRGAPALRRPANAAIAVPAALVVLAGLRPAFGHGPGLDIVSPLNLAFGALGFLMVISDPTGRLPGKLSLLMTVAVAASGAYASLEHWFGPLFVSGRPFAGAASGGTFGNPLFLADALVLVLPYAALRFAFAHRARKALWGGLLAVLTHSLLVTQGRGAWVAALAALAVLCAVLVRTRPGLLARNPGWLAAGALVVAADFYLLSVPGPLNRGGASLAAHAATLAEPMKAGGLRGRLIMWEATALMARERPIAGWGAGRLRANYTRFQAGILARPENRRTEYHTTQHSHNDYLQLAAERGVIGLGAFVWLMAVWFRGMTGLGREGERAYAVRAGALCGVAGWMVDALVNSPFHLTPCRQLFWFALATGWKWNGGRSAPRPAFRPRAWQVAAAGCLVVLLARPYVRDLASEVYLKAGLFLHEAGRYAEALGMEGDAAALALQDRRHWFAMGNTLFGAGEPASAAEAYERDIEANPFLASAWCNLGMARLAAEEPGKAVTALSRAAALDPNEPDILVKLSLALAKAGRTVESAGAWEAARGLGYAEPPPPAVARLLKSRPRNPLPGGRRG